MKIGLNMAAPGPARPLAEILAEIERAEARGLATFWASGRFDALTLLALAATRTGRIELGTAVVATFPRHPIAMAQQALTVQAASGDRLALGVGLSHRRTMEGQLGFDYSRPLVHMREYLTALRALLAGEVVQLRGEQYRLEGYQLAVPNAAPPPLLVAALGPRMLRLAGRLADGTIVWLGGRRYLGEVAVPTIAAAARDAGRPAPRVVAGLPICVTDRATAVRQRVAKVFGRYAEQPVYRTILELDGSVGPGDVAVIGDERAVEADLRALESVGVTDFSAAVFAETPEDAERTWALLAAMAGS